MTASLDVRRGRNRAISRPDGGFSRHAFSAGAVYEPDNVAFGPLIALDEHVLAAGAGFADHRHAGVEILTWPLSGALTHRAVNVDSTITPGTLQYFAAGSGVTHRETASGPAPARFLQMWLVAPTDAPVRYEGSDVRPGFGWRRLAASADRQVELGRWGSRAGPKPVRLDCPGARLDLLRLRGGESADLPIARAVLLHVVTGRLRLGDGTVLEASDSVRRRTGDSRPNPPSEPALRVQVRRPAELLIWSFTDRG